MELNYHSNTFPRKGYVRDLATDIGDDVEHADTVR
jgi:hypothetical protein